MSKVRMTPDQFLKKFKRYNNNTFRFLNLPEKIIRTTPVEVVCSENHTFITKVRNLFQGSGCPFCNPKNRGGTFNNSQRKGQRKVKWTFERFVEEANKVHNSFYIYNEEDFFGKTKKTKITCPNHGDFWQTAESHLDNHGCPKCKAEKQKERLKSSTEEFLKKIKKIHGNSYDYSKTVYTGWDKDITYICPKHGEVSQPAHCHLSGHLCPFCNESKGENKIRQCLEQQQFFFVYNKGVFEDLRSKKGTNLRPDFWIPSQRTVIEFQGEQHLSEKKMKNLMEMRGCEHLVDFEKNFQKLKENDELKKAYFKKHNIKLIEIFPYNDIEKVLQQHSLYGFKITPEFLQQEKEAKKLYEKERSERDKQQRCKRSKQQRMRECFFENRTLTFSALTSLLTRRKVPHPYLEAAKYLVSSSSPTLLSSTPKPSKTPEQIEHEKAWRSEGSKRRNSRLCFYKGKELKFVALVSQLRRDGVENPYSRAKKYLL